MFSTFKSRILLGLFVFVILAIPIGAFFYSQKLEVEVPTASPVPSPLGNITKTPSQNEATDEEDTAPASEPEPTSTPSSAVSFGPTLNLKIEIEGRPKTYQVAKTFVGVASGEKTVKPTYLLIFNVDFPGNGVFEGLSLAGLTQGQTYTAYIKGPSQIDSAVTFLMNPAATNLNGGAAIKLLSGDLNDDNVVNSADFSIASSSFGSNENSANWNQNADFNRDGVINSIDLGIIIKNFGKTGDSGPVTSTPGTASGSAQLNINQGAASASAPIKSGSAMPDERPTPPAPPGQTDGYWIWMPKI